MVPRRIFVSWFGDSQLSTARQQSLEAIHGLGVPVIMINESNLPDWILHEDPLPKTFDLLTANHKADYLRCYLMHHHGGGYTDIKKPGGSWIPSFDALDHGPELGAGYEEFFRGVANFGAKRHEIWTQSWWRARLLQLRYRSLIGNCSFIYKPMTELTTRWLNAEKLKMKTFEFKLIQRPARSANERRGEIVDGVRCDYPVPWTAIGGDVMHPIVLKYDQLLLKTLQPPVTTNYR